jgi:hypothetical protein
MFNGQSGRTPYNQEQKMVSNFATAHNLQPLRVLQPRQSCSSQEQFKRQEEQEPGVGFVYGKCQGRKALALCWYGDSHAFISLQQKTSLNNAEFAILICSTTIHKTANHVLHS